MITISKSYSFDAAHQLQNPEWDDAANVAIFGKCARMHGHTYTLTVEVGGDLSDATGMILNYFYLDEIVKPTIYNNISGLDHFNLNERFNGMLTTAENMVSAIAESIQEALTEQYPDIFLASVALSETPKTSAVWTP